MKLILDEWIIREVIDTLYMARTTLLGITGLDSPQEVAKKSTNETAITRRISKTIDIIQQSEQPEVDLDAEIAIYLNRNVLNRINNSDIIEDFTTIEAGELARHFYELGLSAGKNDY